jgi:HNH endonuclease
MKSLTSSPRNSKYEISDVDLAHFWTKVEKTEACWLWTRTRLSTGYGVIKINNESLLCHRVAFRYTRGFLPGKGLVLDHLCENRLCVNPDHLNVTTIYLNAFRGGRRPSKSIYRRPVLQTYCKRGHLMENTRKAISGNSVCGICLAIRRSTYNARYRAKQKLRAIRDDIIFRR